MLIALRRRRAVWQTAVQLSQWILPKDDTSRWGLSAWVAVDHHDPKKKVRGWVRQRVVRPATANLRAINCAVSHSLHSTLGCYRLFLWQWHHNCEIVTSQLLCMCHCYKKVCRPCRILYSSLFVVLHFVIRYISFYLFVTFVYIRAAHRSHPYDTGTERLGGWIRYPCVVRSAGFAQCSTSNW
jgi:hypothetical protein